MLSEVKEIAQVAQSLKLLKTRVKFNPIAQLCLHFYVILFGQNKYYLIKIVFSIVHRFSDYFMFVIVEATKLFHWVKAIYLSTIFLL